MITVEIRIFGYQMFLDMKFVHEYNAISALNGRVPLAFASAVRMKRPLR